jgi:hypothetical protein
MCCATWQDGGYPGGRLIYYDFGMMEEMEPEIKKGFVDLIFSIYENLPREACDALERMVRSLFTPHPSLLTPTLTPSPSPQSLTFTFTLCLFLFSLAALVF